MAGPIAPETDDERLLRMARDLAVALSSSRHVSGHTDPEVASELGADIASLRSRVLALSLAGMQTILVWEWDDAPAEYSALSTNGGDRVAFVPMSFVEAHGGPPEWLRGSTFGACCVDEYEVEGGIVLVVSEAREH